MLTMPMAQLCDEIWSDWNLSRKDIITMKAFLIFPFLLRQTLFSCYQTTILNFAKHLRYEGGAATFVQFMVVSSTLSLKMERIIRWLTQLTSAPFKKNSIVDEITRVESIWLTPPAFLVTHSGRLKDIPQISGILTSSHEIKSRVHRKN